MKDLKPLRALKQLFNFSPEWLTVKGGWPLWFPQGHFSAACCQCAGTCRFSRTVLGRILSRPNCLVRNQLEITTWFLQREVSPHYSVNISSRTHVKGLLKMCAGPCSPLAALWKWQGLRFSPLQDQVKSIKIYYSYDSAVTSLKAPVISE